MPNKKEGLFHSYMYTFLGVRSLEPELYSPGPESPACTQMNPQHQNQAPCGVDHSAQIASHHSIVYDMGKG
jgi:hypothetical protein